MNRGIGAIITLACLIAALASTASAKKFRHRDYFFLQKFTIDKVPYAVQLRNSSGYIVCAGSLISTQHVLTAAHCFDEYEPIDITVVAGATTNTDAGIQRPILKLFKHETYNPTTFHNDAAVIKLESPVETSRNVFVVNKLCSRPLDNEPHLQSTGWLPTQQDLVHSVTRFPVLSQEACIEDCKEAGVETEITSSMLCGDFNNRFACTHIAGGPAYVGGEICGIVVGGAACANPKFPGLFTNVHAVRDFIETSLKV